jgi:pimeloyl-ACP methyl ester carboxylesterase
MPDPTTHTLDVPGARLYYERRGTGPLLLMIGSPMDSTGFTPLADVCAGTHTVVTYDPRGIGGSSRTDTTADVTPGEQAEDVHRLVAALGDGPVDVFGSSGGATVGLALVTAYPGDVRTLVAHEPPVVELLPDRAEVRAQIEDIYETYRTDGVDKAMYKFMVHAGLAPGGDGEAPAWQPTPEQVARMRATSEVFLAHLIRPTTRYRPDVAALRDAPTRVVVGIGADSGPGQLARRSAEALADGLGTPTVAFPGDHGGFLGRTDEFATVLRRELA